MGVRFIGSSNCCRARLRGVALGAAIEDPAPPLLPPPDELRLRLGMMLRMRWPIVGSATIGPVSVGTSAIGGSCMRRRAIATEPLATAVPNAAISNRFQCFIVKRKTVLTLYTSSQN